MKQLSKGYIKFPVTSDEVENAMEKFKTCCNSKILQSLGAIDGTHIYKKHPKVTANMITFVENKDTQ